MEDKKSKGVVEAIKNRGSFNKKGVSLLGIVKKLSAKRKAAKESKNC